MSAPSQRRADPAAPQRLGSLLLRSRLMMPLILLAGVTLVGAYFAWDLWGDQILDDPSYKLSGAAIDITPPHSWVRCDVTAEVVRDSSLAGLDLLDPDATIQIARAFELHAWVGKVRRVAKRPGGRILVDLTYRQPVVMVAATEGGFWPVDGEGVLLPPGDFTKEETRNFLRVVIGGPQWPRPVVGTPLDDRRVTGAARIAVVLESVWRQLKLKHIVAVAAPNLALAEHEPTYELVTAGGTRVLWGHAPGKEQADESPALDKRQRLVDLVTRSGPLDRDQGPSQIDVSQRAGLSVVPRTARLPRR